MKVSNEFLENAYVQEGRSTYDIANQLGTYPNYVNRLLRKAGIKIRSRNAAQKKAIESGRANHPTEGKHLSVASRRAISRGRSAAWKEMSEEARQKVVETARANWEKLGEAKQAQIREAAQEGLIKASREGSKLEKAIYDGLIQAGIAVYCHEKHKLVDEQQHIDLFLPEKGVAIEIDGPTHFLPIFGEEHLAKVIASDDKKNGLILNAGLSVIRLRTSGKEFSEAYGREALGKILRCLEEVGVEVDGEVKRFFILEV